MGIRETATYRPVEGWEQLPAGHVHADVADVAIDADDNVYLLTRMDPRVIVYAADGTHLRSWGETAFTSRPHAISIGPDGVVHCVDEGDHTIKSFTRDGEPVRVLGNPGQPSDTGVDPEFPYASFRERTEAITHGGPPFNRPTKAVAAPDGDLFVSDGYANARIHHFTPHGELIESWGEPGEAHGQFRAPHCVAVHEDHVWVCDRENERLQIFELDGTLVDVWNQVQRPSSIAFDADGQVYVTEQGWKVNDYSWEKGLIDRPYTAHVCILTPTGSIVDRLGTEDGCAPGSFVAPHGIAVDSTGAIYVPELIASWFTFPAYGPRVPAPEGCHTIQKLARE